MALCLFAQRFGFPLGDQAVSIVGPAGLLLAIWGLAGGWLTLDRVRTMLFLGVVACALIGSAWHMMLPQAFDASPSQKSLLQFLGLTAFATVSFAQPVPEGAFFRALNRLFVVVALAGIVQFALQFAGIRLFAFTGIIPDPLLIETGYNLVIPVGIGDTLKSNGFFLIEPSVFSQFMALALIIEVVNFRRPAQLGLFAVALLLSFSGTGWMVLAAFLAVGGLRLGQRGVRLIALSAVLLIAAVGLMALIAPDFFGALTSRFSELSQPGTSGHMRFVTPFWLIGDVLARVPSALLAGIGAGVSEKLTLPYSFDVNTLVKIFLEFGAPLLVAYLGLFACARRSSAQGALFVPCMLLFLFTGGYQQFPPVLFAVLLLVAVARLNDVPRIFFGTRNPDAAVF